MTRHALLALACGALIACAGGSRDEPAPPIDTALPLPPTIVRAATLRAPPEDARDVMRLHFIDIGQGDATLLEFPCGAALIDTGGEQNERFDGVAALVEYLDAFFARREDLDRTLDLLVLTHPHIDHLRGADAVLERYRVRNIVDNGSERAGEIGGDEQIAVHRWLADPARADVGYLHAKAADMDPARGNTSALIDPIGACERSRVDPKFTLLWGQVTEDLETYGDDPNNHSVVTRVEFGEASALFTGDLEFIGLSRLFEHYRGHERLFDVDIYQVGHHGSKNATTHYLMQAMSPELAVISAGPYERDLDWTARRYGHPNITALRELVHHEHGVGGFRERAVEVWVGIKGAWVPRAGEDPSRARQEVFERRTIARAVYATSWDGTVVVDAHANGSLAVTTSRAPSPSATQ
ncbi:MAG: MBL fold metallo-hydrolase [Myxococcales bacterium]|nr:MBL fold metallo-hydrolase [Myxococcales bacterium]